MNTIFSKKRKRKTLLKKKRGKRKTLLKKKRGKTIMGTYFKSVKKGGMNNENNNENNIIDRGDFEEGIRITDMPKIALGTANCVSSENLENYIARALVIGYRHIHISPGVYPKNIQMDTDDYLQAIKNGLDRGYELVDGLKRTDIWITCCHSLKGDVEKAIEKFDYIDACEIGDRKRDNLIHYNLSQLATLSDYDLYHLCAYNTTLNQMKSYIERINKNGSLCQIYSTFARFGSPDISVPEKYVDFCKEHCIPYMMSLLFPNNNCILVGTSGTFDAALAMGMDPVNIQKNIGAYDTLQLNFDLYTQYMENQSIISDEDFIKFESIMGNIHVNRW